LEPVPPNPSPSQPSCIGQEEGLVNFNPVTNRCEAQPTCESGTFDAAKDICVTPTLPDGIDPGLFFNADDTGDSTPATIIACDNTGEITVDSGDSGTIKCGSITVSIISGSVDVQFNTNSGPATTTMGALDSITYDVDTLTFTNNSVTSVTVIKIGGQTITLSPGETLTAPSIGESPVVEEPPELSIPEWVKNTAGWWAERSVDDSDFTGGISYLIEEDIISIPDLPESTGSTEEAVPEWVRNMAGWWADDLTTDQEFADAIKFLVEKGIIQVS